MCNDSDNSNSKLYVWEILTKILIFAFLKVIF